MQKGYTKGPLKCRQTDFFENIFIKISLFTFFKNFSEITAKNIILKCASVLSLPPEAVGFSLDFMMGKTMNDIHEDALNISETPSNAIPISTKAKLRYCFFVSFSFK